MGEVLSQQEIDSLYDKIKSGGDDIQNAEPEKEAIPFDFRLPNRISKNQLRVIRNIHENFAESLSAFLVSKLQTIVNITVASVDQIYYSEYVLSVSNPACLFNFEIERTDIKGILEFSPDLAMIFVDRLFGGHGGSAASTKGITPIEQNILLIIVNKIMQDLNKAWKVIGDLSFVVGKFEPDIDFAQITSQSDSVLLISFEVNVGEQNYLMNLCFATYAFDSILQRLNSHNMSTMRTMKSQGSDSQKVITNNLYKTYLPVTVEFGNARISLNGLMNLQKGDIIKLNTKISDEHTIKIGNKVLFKGRAGVVNKHKAVKITRKVQPIDN